jgi:hypothetical protein
MEYLGGLPSSSSESIINLITMKSIIFWILKEQACLEVTFQICIWEKLWSNLRRDTGYPEWGFLEVPPSLQTNKGLITRLGHDSILPNLFLLLFICHAAIRNYTVTMLKVSLCNPWNNKIHGFCLSDCFHSKYRVQNRFLHIMFLIFLSFPSICIDKNEYDIYVFQSFFSHFRTTLLIMNWFIEGQ